MNPVTAKDVRKVLRLSDEGYSDTFDSKPFETNPSLSIVHAWYRAKFGVDFEKGGPFNQEIGGLEDALESRHKGASFWAEVFNLTEELNASFWESMKVYLDIQEERKAADKLPPADISDEPSLMDVLNGPGITLNELNDWQEGKR